MKPSKQLYNTVHFLQYSEIQRMIELGEIIHSFWPHIATCIHSVFPVTVLCLAAWYQVI